MSPEEKVEDVEITAEDRQFLEKELPKEQDEQDEAYEKRLKVYKTTKDKAYKSGAQKRIDEVIRKTREQLEAAEEENRILREEREAPKEIEAKVTDADMIIAGGKKWYPNRILRSMIEKGEITQEEMDDYRDDRTAAIAADSSLKRGREELTKEEILKIRKQDSIDAKKNYSFLNDPDDPLYKLSDELWQEGLKYNPRGLSIAAKRAKEILGKGELSAEERANKARELEVEAPGPASRPKSKEMTLSEGEKYIAEQLYKNLSPEEAHKKALKAKKRRMEAK